MGAIEKVWYFDKPVIAICIECDEFAIYKEGKGLVCPKCGSSKHLAIFEWDGDSEYPE